MPISTVDGIVAGGQPLRDFVKALSGTLVAGRPFSYWAIAGVPGPGSYNTTANGAVLSSSSSLVAGQIPHYDPVSGKSYLASALGFCAQQSGIIKIVDRIWQSRVQSSTSIIAQTLTSPAFPARDNNESLNGEGYLCTTEVSGAMGAGAPTLTLSYTNSAGISGRTTTTIEAVVASAIAGSCERFGLQAGDLGIKSIESITASVSRTSGTYDLVVYKVLANLPLLVGVPMTIDAILQALQKIPNGAVPYIMFVPSTTTSSAVGGHLIETQG